MNHFHEKCYTNIWPIFDQIRHYGHLNVRVELVTENCTTRILPTYINKEIFVKQY